MEVKMDKAQKLRYSRQLATYGKDMQLKLMELKIFIYGCRGLGAEIAKHLTLNGINEVHICDPTPAETRDLSANYLMNPSLIGTDSPNQNDSDSSSGNDQKRVISRAEATIKGIQSLNRHVECKVIENLSLDQILEHKYNGVIITEPYGLDWSDNLDLCNNIYNINNVLRNNDICFILTESIGMYGYIFNDFGDHFKIINTGIEEDRFKIKDMTFESECVLTFNYECVDTFEVGDIVEFLNLEGSLGIQLLNEKEYHIVEYINEYSIRINCDTSNFSYFMDGAFLSLKKRGETKNYFSLKESLNKISKSELCGNKSDLALLKILLSYRQRYEKSYELETEQDNETSLQSFSKEILPNLLEEFGEDIYDLNNLSEVIPKFVRSIKCEIIAITSIIGSLAASEALKITGKYIPINQWYAYNSVRFMPDVIDRTCLDPRYQDNIDTFGSEVQMSLSIMNIFLPGVGAIGCEVLKCIACLGCCSIYDQTATSQGIITMVDFDRLEISNLNRQFLFTEGDKGKRKANVAKAKILKVNPKLNIKTHLFKLDLDVYRKDLNFSFWNELDLVINGLDNVAGRVYCDRKCNEFEIPFFECGTEGQMAHTALIIPNLSNCYEDSNINQNTEVVQQTTPFCTLRNEPYLINHCIEWAMSKYNDHFVVGMRDLKVFCETNISNQIDLTYGEVEFLMKILEWVSNHKCIITFGHCLEFALTEFDQYFNKDIALILESNRKANERAETSLSGVSKVEPNPQKFSIDNDEICSDKSDFEYVYCYAYLLYTAFNGDNVNKELFPEECVRQELNECKQPKIKPEQTRQRAKEIFLKLQENRPKSCMEESKSRIQDDEEEEIITTKQQENTDSEVQIQIDFCNKLSYLREKIKSYPNYLEVIKNLQSTLDLDKDNEIMLGFIHSASCIRATIFNINHSHLTLDVTQLSLGRIIPAVSTSTAGIIGLLMSEVIKMKVGIKDIQDLREYNINLGCAMVNPFIVSKAKYKQLNSDINYKDIYKYAVNPSKFIEPNCFNMNEEGFWNSWFKHTMQSTVTPREIEAFIKEEYNADVLYYEIYPDFCSKDLIINNGNFDNPVIVEFSNYVNTATDDFCILHIGCEPVIEGELKPEVQRNTNMK